MSITKLTDNQKYRYKAALANMPTIFTVGMYRASLGLKPGEFGPEWNDASAMLRSFKRRGLIRKCQDSNKWEKVF